MKLMSKAFICGLAVTAATAVGCSSNMSKGLGSNPGHEATTGEIGVNLTLANGSTLNGLNFSLTNTVAADDVTGTIPLPTGPLTFPFTVSTYDIIPVVAASGYSIALTGTSSDGSVTCTGNATGITVTAGNETVVNVLVTCTSTANNGSVEVNATLQSCPTVQATAINATANTTAPGNTSTIFASAAAPNPATLTYAFAVTTGTGSISAPTTVAGNASSSAIFTCPTAAEKDTITITTTDQTGATCGALGVATVTVTCGVPLVACQNPTVGTGTEATPDTAAGTCPAGTTNTGTLKDAAGNFCCSPLPCFGVGNGVEVTGDTATGACTSGINSGTLKDGSGNFCCSALLPCTTAGQTGCVQCTGSASTTSLCTPTEAQLVAFDIKTGADKAPGAPATGSCYQCLNAKGCLDDNVGDTGAECEDGAFTDTTTQAQCQSTLSCILGTSCNASALSACYCGAATPSGTCTTDTTAVSDPVPASTNPAVIGGSCDVEISNGLGTAITGIADGIDVLKNLTNATLAAGRANAILACGVAGKCTACQ